MQHVNTTYTIYPSTVGLLFDRITKVTNPLFCLTNKEDGFLVRPNTAEV